MGALCKIFVFSIPLLVSFLTPPVFGEQCQPGIILPVWMPQEDLSTLEIVGRGVVYFLAMVYMFLGVSIVSDRFMGAIEVITSKQRKIKVKTSAGNQTVVVRVWNETVANLTLMALGSSAPEILLSVIEVIGKDFSAGELGPGTIVGSAAFNFFVIIGICILAIPTGQIRRIKHLRVFFVTASWSLFAYIWLLIILKLSSPGIVEIWEGVVTFLFFFVTVLTAYVADRNLLKIDKLRKTYRLNKRGVIVEGEANTELGTLPDAAPEAEDPLLDSEVTDFERKRADYVALLTQLRRRYPNSGPELLETMARKELFQKEPKSRAFYRIQATRNFVRSPDMLKKLDGEPRDGAMYTLLPTSDPALQDQDHVTRLYFDSPKYAVKEDVGSFDVTVTRGGGHLIETVLVDYETENGTATGGQDFVATSGTFTFGPGVVTNQIRIEVIDDDVFELDEHFFIRLKNPRFEHGRQKLGGGRKGMVKVDIPFRATVTILDDDHAGYFNVAEAETETTEGTGIFEAKITRSSGARGKVILGYTTVDGMAKPGKDYEHVQGELKFEDNETEKVVKIQILDENSYEKDVSFYLQLSTPIPLDAKDNKLVFREKTDRMTQAEKIASEGWPKLGSVDKGQIRIRESSAFKSTVDTLLKRDSGAVVVGSSSWKEQFVEAISVNSSGDEGSSRPSCGDYFMHILTVFWKVFFAFIPPTSILDGYLTFVVSILVIGVLTAFIGDVASHLGCTIGLEDSITAIAIIALGTSVPDTFASRVAAVQDATADAAIGNVTGSNAVNVFLGIGIAWTLAAIVRAFRTCTPEFPECDVFRVDPGSLGFSVSIFCGCAVLGIILLLIRRLPVFGGGELGGPSKTRYPTAILFICLWIFYVVISSLEVYGVISGF